MRSLQAEVLVLRGAIAESRHRVQCAVVDGRGELVAGTEEAAAVTSFRSSAKPFQLLPFVERGHADTLHCSDAEAVEEVRRDPSLASRLYNNCSGKHAGMLAMARAEGWPVAGYERLDHPL